MNCLETNRAITTVVRIGEFHKPRNSTPANYTEQLLTNYVPTTRANFRQKMSWG